MTDNDKALVERLRWSASGKVGAEQARLERNAADRIEAQAARIAEWDETGRQLTTKVFEQAAEIERLREALGWFINDKRFVVQVGGNPNVVPSMIDAATKIYFGETLHVAETCKENGETFT